MNRWEINAGLNRIAEGDERAFERLYEGIKGGVYSFAYSYLKNREDAEDAVQTVFLKIKKNAATFDKNGNGLAWILQITKNVALNELRSRKAYENFVSLKSNDETYVTDESDFDSPITATMRKYLTEEEQRIIVLHVLWGYKHREISELLNIPTGSVTSKYKRAVDKIKANYKKEA